MRQRIAEDMLVALARAANTHDYAAHMALISRDVHVFGVPDFAVIGYEDWARQCQYEFEQGLLQYVGYEGLHVISATSTHILLKTTETIEGTDGTNNRYGPEVLVHRDGDGVWRIPQKRIIADEEREFDRHKSR